VITPWVLRDLQKVDLTEVDIACGQLASGAFFYAMQSCRYTKVYGNRRTKLHYARRRRKKGCDWCVVKVVTSLRVDRTCDACLHWHQYSLTSEFLKVPNIYLMELSSST
jgi:allantoicase